MSKASDNKHDRQHLRNLSTYQLRIDRIYQDIIREAARLGASVGEIKPDTAFSFDDYPTIRKRVEKLMSGLKSRLTVSIVNGIDAEWTLANNKNSELARRVFGDKADKLTEAQQRRYFSTNDSARQAFQQRRVNGLNLSERVWRYADQFKNEIEMGLDLGIRSGLSADEMSRDLRQYLRRPDMLFRRVRDEHGQLHLSKRAADYHPGRGVYRSSYMNARRLAATEANIAYRTSDHLRWQQMDFVVGIEIRLSNNHTCKGSDGKPRPFTDICDKLQGRYPKDFKFTGWHPHCRCYAISILKTQEEIAEDTRKILNGEKPDTPSVNTVKDVPQEFKDWIADNADRIKAAEARGTIPYFIKDNQARVNEVLNNTSVSDVASIPAVDSFGSLSLSEKYDRITAAGWEIEDFDYFKESPAINFDFAEFKSKFDEIMKQSGIEDMDYEITGLNRREFRFRIDGAGVTLSREFKVRNGELEVYHKLFEMPKRMQGKGISKATFRALFKEYERMGVRRITVHANLDIGGYTWSRYGFCAVNKDEAISAVEYDRTAVQLIEDYYKKNGLSEDSPFPMNIISDKLGKDSLLHSSWDGVLDFHDAERLKKFKAYLGLK